METNNTGNKLEINLSLSLSKHILSKHLNCKVYDKEKLKILLKHLRQKRKKKCGDKQKEFCLRKETTEVRTDTQVKLRCHQLPNVVQELRRTILRQDWDETLTLLLILCHPGLKLYTPIILRICCILFFNHLNSKLKTLQDFIRIITGYVLEEDVNKFIKILFALRKSAVTIAENGKYIRKTSGYKITRDYEFEGL